VIFEEVFSVSTFDKHEIDPVKEIIREYLLVREELEVIRKMLFLSLRRGHDKSTRTYAGTLKDYRGIQVKLLHTLVDLGVERSEDDLVKLLSDLPEVRCDVKDCQCAYHKSVKKILEPAMKRNDNS